MKPNKITQGHLARKALIYVRQSSLAQVRNNTESTTRQYGLADHASQLGWASTLVEVIDEDLGRSGRSAQERSGFQYLVSQVCLGEVGAIFGLEISRLARSSADLSRLLEFARLTNTLVIDADGIYDLGDFNDRLLLGLKGTMSEAELHILAGRLQGAKRAAASRGELRFPLPVGFVYDDEGQTILDPDEQVVGAVADLFAAFVTTGSAYGVVGVFADRLFPRRAYGGVWAGQLKWGHLTHSRVLGVLSNPAYAGAYVFGRYRSRRTVEPDGSVHTHTVELPRTEWEVVIHDHHSGYITWDAFVQNEAKLKANDVRGGARPAREGLALLQGILFCGGCGRSMSARYRKDGKADYECAKSRADHVATPACRSIAAEPIDQAIAQRLLAALTPDEVALALDVADEVEERRSRSTRAAELAVERADYEAARAERAFLACEPENRLVGRSLEARWESKLEAKTQAVEALMAAQLATKPMPQRADLELLAADLPELWLAKTTSDRDRKRLLRTLIADVTICSEPGEEKCKVGIGWCSGATEELVVLRKPRSCDARRTPAEAVELICRLGPTMNNAELLAELNAAQFTTGTGRPFDLKSVSWTRHAYGAKQLAPADDGKLSVGEVAARLGVTAGTVYYWIAHDQLDAQRDKHGRIRVPFDANVEAGCRQRVAESNHIKPETKTTIAGGAI